MRAKWGKPAIAGQLYTYYGVTNSNESERGQFGTCRLAAYRVYKLRAKWGKPAIAGQLPTTGLPTRMIAKGDIFGTCRLAAYRVYKLN